MHTGASVEFWIADSRLQSTHHYAEQLSILINNSRISPECMAGKFPTYLIALESKCLIQALKDLKCVLMA